VYQRNNNIANTTTANNNISRSLPIELGPPMSDMRSNIEQVRQLLVCHWNSLGLLEERKPTHKKGGPNAPPTSSSSSTSAVGTTAVISTSINSSAGNSSESRRQLPPAAEHLVLSFLFGDLQWVRECVCVCVSVCK
jgi:hypothetical protein